MPGDDDFGKVYDVQQVIPVLLDRQKKQPVK